MAVFKKILASTLALAAIAAAGTTAAAVVDPDGLPSYCKPWSVNYIYGAPSSVSSPLARRTLYTSGAGYQTDTREFNGGGDGHVSVRVGDKEYWRITGKYDGIPREGCQIKMGDASTIVFDIWAVGYSVSAKGYIRAYGIDSPTT